MKSNQVEEVSRNIRQLQQLQYCEIYFARLIGGWLPGIVPWEIKHQVAGHLWEDAQHSRDLRMRLWELRKPNPDQDIPPSLTEALRSLALAQTDVEFLAGLYLVFKKKLLAVYEAFLAQSNPVYDGPSLPLIKKIIQEESDQIAWAEKTVPQMAKDELMQNAVRRWQQFVTDLVENLDGLDPVDADRPNQAPIVPPPGYSLLLPFPDCKRDDRFDVRLEGGAPPDPADHQAQVLWQFNNYAQEMQAAETLGSLLWEVEDAPWEFYLDVARHCWDEARHSKLGENRLLELGHTPMEFPHMTGNYTWRQLVDPMRRFCILTYVIEAGSFEYKHRTFEEHVAHGDLESAKAILYDIIDETMHVRFGKKWLPVLMKMSRCEQSLEELVEECREITRRNSFSPEQQRSAIAKAA